MRIVLVLASGHDSYGGPVAVVRGLQEVAELRGHSVVTVPALGDSDRGLRLGGSTIYWPGIRVLSKLRREIASADILHVHGLWYPAGSLAAAWARTNSVPYVVTLHGMLDLWSMRHSGLKKRIWGELWEWRNLEGAAAVHFGNARELQEASEVRAFDRTFIDGNGIDFEEFQDLPARSEMAREWPLTSDRTVVLFLGRLHPKKGIDELIRGFDTARQQMPELLLLIAGPGGRGYRRELQQLAKRTTSATSILFVGPLYGESKRRALGGAAVFALTSHEECDSVAIKEALAAGLPVLVTPGCKVDYLDDPAVGQIVEVDPAEIAEGLLSLVRPSAVTSGVDLRAKAIARAFDKRVVGDRMLLEYERIVGITYQ